MGTFSYFSAKQTGRICVFGSLQDGQRDLLQENEIVHVIHLLATYTTCPHMNKMIMATEFAMVVSSCEC